MFGGIITYSPRWGKIKIGGTVLNILKKLNGDKLLLPSLSTVEASAIGRGETAVCMMVCSCTEVISEGITVFIFFILTLKLLKLFLIASIEVHLSLKIYDFHSLESPLKIGVTKDSQPS